MWCPKCEGNMEEQAYGESKAHRCTQCKGLWFAPNDLEHMKDAWMSEFLDSGDPVVGKKYNAIDDIPCPVCGEKMRKETDAQQKHIWYESCPAGHGIFFDAGEFTDWKYDTLMDRFRAFFTKKRV